MLDKRYQACEKGPTCDHACHAHPSETANEDERSEDNGSGSYWKDNR